MIFSNTNPNNLSLGEIREEAYKQGRADALAEVEEIIKSKTNPIQTIEMLIKQIKEQK